MKSMKSYVVLFVVPFMLSSCTQDVTSNTYSDQESVELNQVDNSNIQSLLYKYKIPNGVIDSKSLPESFRLSLKRKGYIIPKLDPQEHISAKFIGNSRGKNQNSEIQYMLDPCDHPDYFETDCGAIYLPPVNPPPIPGRTISYGSYINDNGSGIFDFGSYSISDDNLDFIGVVGISHAGSLYLGTKSQSGTNSNFAGVSAQYNMYNYGNNYNAQQSGYHEFELGDEIFEPISSAFRYFSY